MKTTRCDLAAFYLADSIQLKAFKQAYTGNLRAETNTELYYALPNECYLYVFHYGVVVFANMSDADMSVTLQVFNPYIQNPLPEKIRDDFTIDISDDGQPLRFDFNSVQLPQIDEQAMRVVMLNLAQSVALDYYANTAENLLAKVRKFTTQLEKTGSLKISRKNMLRFLGEVLNAQNRIAENLYIFDRPDLVWDDEYLNRLHAGLLKIFDLPLRFKEIEYTFKITEDNLDVFKEIYHHRESSILEWIIIVLILIEVFDLLWNKLGG